MIISKNSDDSNIRDEIHVLTLKEPWVYHLLNSGKDVENRIWKLWNGFTGVPIAIHAGKTIDKNVTPMYQIDKQDLTLSKIQAFVVFDGLNPESEWAIYGQYNWKIMETWQIPDPIPYDKGQQGIWTVPRSLGLSDLWNERHKKLKRVYKDGDNDLLLL